MLEWLLEIKDVNQLVSHVKYALGIGEKPSKFSPRAYSYMLDFLKDNTLDDLIREISLATLPDEFQALLSGIDLEGFVVFPADLVPGIVYVSSAKAHPYSLTPFHELLEMVGRVGSGEKCVLILSGVIDVPIPKSAKTRMAVYRNRILKSCEDLIVIGGIRDEKHLFRIGKKVKLARSIGKRKDGTYIFLAWFSNDGEIDPYSVPSILSGGILSKLAEHWEPLGRRYEVVRYLPPGEIRARVVTISNIEEGKVVGDMKERKVNEKTVLGKGDVVVALKGRELRVGVIEEDGKFSVDPNTLGIRVSNVEEAEALVRFMLFPPIKKALEENFCLRPPAPFITDSLILSLPIPPDLKGFLPLLNEMIAEYEEGLKELEKRLEEKLMKAAEDARILRRVTPIRAKKTIL